MNPLVKKTLASMFKINDSQVEMLFRTAEAFKKNEIDKDLAFKVLDKVSKKTPQEINRLLEKINMEV